MNNGRPILFFVVASVLLFTSSSLLVSCAEGGLDTASTNAEADLAIINGKVITVDKDFSVAEAVAVKDGKIIAVGLKSDVEKMIGENTKILDLKGETVLPGINDSHLHFQWLATRKSSPVLNMQLTPGPPPTTTREQDKQAMLASMQELSARGITSITEPGLGNDFIGLIFAYKSNNSLNLTMTSAAVSPTGPLRQASEDLMISIVFGGRATPLFLKHSSPASALTTFKTILLFR